MPRGGRHLPRPAGEPAGGRVPSEDRDAQAHAHAHTRTHTASLAVFHTPGACIGVHTQTHADADTPGTATRGSGSPHSLRLRPTGAGRRTPSDTNARSHRFTLSHTHSHTRTGSVPLTQKHPGAPWQAHTHPATPPAALRYQHTVRHTWVTAPRRASPRNPRPYPHSLSEIVHTESPPTDGYSDTIPLPTHSGLCRQPLHCSAPTVGDRPMPWCSRPQGQCHTRIH